MPERWSQGAARVSRRQVLAGLAAAAGGLTAAGCGSGSGGPQTIEVWIWETVDQWHQVIKESGFAQKFPGVTIKFTSMAADQIKQKALTALGAGVASGLPSIIRIGMDVYRTLVQTKALTDFTNVVTQHKADVLPNVYDGLLVDGRIYAAPDDTGVLLYGYRNDLFQRAGLPTQPDEVEGLLATYDDLLKIGPRLAAAGMKLFNDNAGSAMFTDLILQDTTGYFDKNGEVIFDSDQHVKCAEVTKKFYDSGFLTSYEDDSPEMWNAHKTGKLASMFYPNWEDFIIVQNAPQTRDKWNVVKLPAVMPGGKRACSADGCAMIVPAVLDKETRRTAVDVVTFLKLTKQAQVAHMKTFAGAFCSYQPALEAMADVPSPVLRDQHTYQVDLKDAQDEKVLPWYRISAFFDDADTAAKNAMFKICKNDAPVQATLKSAADSIRKMQDQRGVK